MPLRYQRNHQERNRKQAKLRFIRARNAMLKHPDCAYGGGFYCDHVYDPKYPWCWVDFRFFHTQKKMYYAVAMSTAEYNGDDIAQQRAWDDAEKVLPYRKISRNIDDWIKDINDGPTEYDDKRSALKDELYKKYATEEYSITPSIVLRDYGKSTVGVWATVNREYIDEHYIREFIKRFREELGEPTKPGWTWKDDEIKVVPKIFNDRYPYGDRTAES